jgi:hypothetical protein
MLINRELVDNLINQAAQEALAANDEPVKVVITNRLKRLIGVRARGYFLDDETVPALIQPEVDLYRHTSEDRRVFFGTQLPLVELLNPNCLKEVSLVAANVFDTDTAAMFVYRSDYGFLVQLRNLSNGYTRTIAARDDEMRQFETSDALVTSYGVARKCVGLNFYLRTLPIYLPPNHNAEQIWEAVRDYAKENLSVKDFCTILWESPLAVMRASGLAQPFWWDVTTYVDVLSRSTE